MSTINIILFFLAGTTAVAGNFLLKAGINQIGDFSLSLNQLTQTLFKMLLNWRVFIGFILYGLSSVLYLKLLASTEITKSYPALVAYMATMMLILGTLFLKETLTLPKVVGTVVIVLGIFLLNR